MIVSSAYYTENCKQNGIPNRFLCFDQKADRGAPVAPLCEYTQNQAPPFEKNQRAYPFYLICAIVYLDIIAH